MLDSDFDADRFLFAQQDIYSTALAELKNGCKQSHWMWFVFPQLAGLGRSETARYYALSNLTAARQYLNHPVLGARLLECSQAILAVEGRTVQQMLGFPDNLKLHSCMTLFALVCPDGSIFQQVLDKYFAGARDVGTLALLTE